MIPFAMCHCHNSALMKSAGLFSEVLTKSGRFLSWNLRCRRLPADRVSDLLALNVENLG